METKTYKDFSSDNDVTVSFPRNGVFWKDERKYSLLRNVEDAIDYKTVEKSIAIENYSSGAGSWVLNYALRNGWLSIFTAENCSEINDIIEKYGNVQPNLLSFRGMKKLEGFRNGYTFGDLAYTTKTLSLDLANGYARPNYGGNEKDEYCILFIKSSINKILYIGQRFGKSSNTYEVISFPGEIYKIIDQGSVKINNRVKQTYYVEIVGNFYSNIEDLYTFYQDIEDVFDMIKRTLVNLNDDDILLFIKDRKDKDDRLNNLYYKKVTNPVAFEEYFNTLQVETSAVQVDTTDPGKNFYTVSSSDDNYSEVGYYAGQDYYSGDTVKIIHIKNFIKYFNKFLTTTNLNYIVKKNGNILIRTDNRNVIEDYLYADIVEIENYDLEKTTIWTRKFYGYANLKLT